MAVFVCNLAVMAAACSSPEEAVNWCDDVQLSPEVAGLIRDLGSNDAVVLQRAKWALVREGRVPLLCATQESDPGIRANAVHALGLLKDASALPRLVHLRNDADKYVRMWTAFAFGEIGDCGTLPHLVQYLEDQDVNVRAMAIRALAKLDTRDVVPIVAKQVGSKDQYISHEASAAITASNRTDMIPELIRLLETTETHVRDNAVYAIALLAGVPVAEGEMPARYKAAWRWWHEHGRERFDQK